MVEDIQTDIEIPKQKTDQKIEMGHEFTSMIDDDQEMEATRIKGKTKKLLKSPTLILSLGISNGNLKIALSFGKFYTQSAQRLGCEPKENPNIKRSGVSNLRQVRETNQPQFPSFAQKLKIIQ